MPLSIIFFFLGGLWEDVFLWPEFFHAVYNCSTAAHRFSGRLDLAVSRLRSLKAKKQAISEFVLPPLPLALLMFLQA